MNNNDLAKQSMGMLVAKAHLAAFLQGRKLDGSWRLAIHQDDYTELVDMAGDNMEIVEAQCPAPLRVLDVEEVEIVEGKPQPLRGQLLVVPPEQVHRLGLD